MSERPENPAQSTQHDAFASRRRLTAVTAGVGGAGVVAATVPFVLSLAPSERAKALGAPVTVSTSRSPKGGLLTVEWRGRPVWLLRRDAAMLEALQSPELRAMLADSDSQREEQQPSYAANAFRSIRPELGVYVALCTHLGCIPSYRPEAGAPDLPAGWLGGFYCPCHGSKFDFAGRVYRNVPAPTNLVVPPHRFLDDSTLEIGADSPAG